MSLDWEPQGKPLGQDAFERIEPKDIIYELDSPMIFTFFQKGYLYLAYMCGAKRGTSRFIIVPARTETADHLRKGVISVRGALDQPWMWCVDVKSDGSVERSWITSPSELPSSALPQQGVMLDPSLEPVFSVRVDGRSLSHDNVPASAVKRAVDGAYTALKKLSETTPSPTGRPGKAWKQFFDLFVQRIALGSFEIAFQEPSPQQESLPEMGGVREEFAKLTEDFAIALDWAVQKDGISDAPRLQLLEAMEKLIPPQHGPIEKVHIGGRIFRHKKYVLDRQVTQKVRKALLSARANQETIKTVFGEPRELDKDKMSFRLHEYSTGHDYACTFTDDMYEDIFDVFSSDAMVNVTIRHDKRSFSGEVVALSPPADETERDD